MYNINTEIYVVIGTEKDIYYKYRTYLIEINYFSSSEPI